MSPDNLRILMCGILATAQNERVDPAQRLSIIASAAQGALGVLADFPSPSLVLAIEVPTLDTLNRTPLEVQWVVAAVEA